MLFWAIWMDVEIILCEVNKTERQISYDIMYMLSLIKIIEKAYLQDRNKLTDFKTNLMITIGKRLWEGKEELEGWEYHIHFTI